MLKNNPDKKPEKKGSLKNNYQGPLASGLNRRAFLKTTIAVSLLSGFIGCKPSTPEIEKSATIKATVKSLAFKFPQPQRQILDKVLLHLFPDDGDGPDAQDLNALTYLEWALTDERNISDGDPEFILEGIGWLDELAEQTQGDKFLLLTHQQQDKVLKQTAKSKAGENWMSLLMYYLTEALLLDPVYGGNTNRVGWDWLEHQAGFPQPIAGKTYRDFV